MWTQFEVFQRFLITTKGSVIQWVSMCQEIFIQTV